MTWILRERWDWMNLKVLPSFRDNTRTFWSNPWCEVKKTFRRRIEVDDINCLRQIESIFKGRIMYSELCPRWDILYACSLPLILMHNDNLSRLCRLSLSLYLNSLLHSWHGLGANACFKVSVQFWVSDPALILAIAVRVWTTWHSALYPPTFSAAPRATLECDVIAIMAASSAKILVLTWSGVSAAYRRMEVVNESNASGRPFNSECPQIDAL